MSGLALDKAPASSDHRVPVAELQQAVSALFAALGSGPAEAGLMAEHLVRANHYGHDSHGISLIPLYLRMLREGKVPLILDFATSRAAQGKMRIAMNRGEPVPAGYLLDERGEHSLDPGVVYRSPIGALLPFGEHKGAGLGFVCDVLAGALSGAGTLHPGTLEDGVYINNMLSIVIDPARLGGMHTWQQELEAGAAYVGASPPRPGMGPVLLPGELEQHVAQQRSRDGIPVDRGTWASIEEAARLSGVSWFG
jgi:uncharacterized oxidoreductase